MRHPITEQQRKQLNCCVSLANSEKNFSPVKGDTFVTTHNKILIKSTKYLDSKVDALQLGPQTSKWRYSSITELIGKQIASVPHHDV